MACCCLLGGTALAAPSVTNLEQNSDDARQSIDRLADSLVQSRSGLDSAEAEAEASASRENGLETLLADGAQRSRELGQRSETSKRALLRSRQRLVRARQLLADRLVAIYTSGTPDLSELFLAASDFGELASTAEYLLAIQQSDQQLASRVDELRAELSGETSRLSTARQQVDAHNAELAAARDGFAAARSAAESSARELAAVSQSRQTKIESLKSDINSWQKKIEKAEAAPPAAAAAEVEQMLGGPYSIPTYIVMCESGGNYSALNPSSGAGGAYQIIPSTWEAYGGSGLPHEASKAEQDRIAALIYADSGTAPWVCG